MAYITRIQGTGVRNLQSLDVELPASEQQPFRHLLLTGPNGSGKSGVLEFVGNCLAACRSGKSSIDMSGGETHGNRTFMSEMSDERSSHIRLWFTDAFWKAQADDRAFVMRSPARRGQEWVPQPVRGPQELDLKTLTSGQGDTTRFLKQFLVNQRTQQAFALADGDQSTAQRLQRWFGELEQQLRTVMGDPALGFTFDRKAYTFRFESRGYAFDLDTMADGHSAVFSLLGDLLLRVQACRDALGDQTFDPTGIAVIDELETHLHLELQEQILPLLTSFFPRVQFIVATHSPAVISSVDNAVVYDLGRHEATLSRDYVGVRYGALMTEHFGISEDFDRRTEAELKELRELWANVKRSSDEQTRMQRLADELSRRSYGVAREIQLRMAMGQHGSDAA